MYGKADNTYAAFGLAPGDYDDTTEIWPENWTAWDLFVQMSGQWRLGGLGGKYAMDYTPLFMRMERMRLSDVEWEALYLDVRVLEAAALEALYPHAGK